MLNLTVQQINITCFSFRFSNTKIKKSKNKIPFLYIPNSLMNCGRVTVFFNVRFQISENAFRPANKNAKQTSHKHL